MLSSALEASEIGLTANADKDRIISGNYRLTIAVNAHAIQFDERNNRRTATLILAPRLESSKDKNVKATTISLSVPGDQFQSVLTNGVPLTSRFPGSPGDRLRVEVQDQATGLVGALWLPLTDQ
jgi:hypothetical protein